MAGFEFLPVSRSTTLFEVAEEGFVIGIVWQRGDLWHASPIGTADLSILGSSRNDVAGSLANSLKRALSSKA